MADEQDAIESLFHLKLIVGLYIRTKCNFYST